jgi:16S rRNA (guanine966-N2)-methyltransferase
VRIVGGEARGRPLRAVPGRSTRPTSDRVRQSLFDVLGQRCDGLRVLDLFCGTGALGLEALSRGAKAATLVDEDKDACAVALRNAGSLGYGDRCTVVREDVFRALPRLAGPYDLVFSDPPYAARATGRILEVLANNPLLAEGGRAVLEKDRREPLPQVPAGLRLVEERRYGDTILVFVEWAG